MKVNWSDHWKALIILLRFYTLHILICFKVTVHEIGRLQEKCGDNRKMNSILRQNSCRVVCSTYFTDKRINQCCFTLAEIVCPELIQRGKISLLEPWIKKFQHFTTESITYVSTEYLSSEKHLWAVINVDKNNR